MWVMKAQGLPYMNRKPKPVPVPTEENGCGRFAPQSFQEFLLTSGKQLDINIIIITITTIIITIIIKSSKSSKSSSSPQASSWTWTGG